MINPKRNEQLSFQLGLKSTATSVGLEQGKSNIHEEDTDLVAVALALDQAKDQEARGKLAGTIRTKDKCKIDSCGEAFKLIGNAGMLCPVHKTAPTAYFIDFSYDAEGGKTRKKIYSSQYRQPLTSYRLARDTQDEITYRIRNGTFDPEDFRSKISKEERQKWHLWDRWRGYADEHTRANTINNDKQAQKHIFALSEKDKKDKDAFSFRKDKDMRYLTQEELDNLAKYVKKVATPGIARIVLGKLLACVRKHKKENKRQLKGLDLTMPTIDDPNNKNKTKKIKNIPPLEDTFKIIECIPPEDRDIFIFTLLHADRPSETVVVKVSDFDFGKVTVLIQRCADSDNKEGETKTGVDEPIPIHQQVYGYYLHLSATKKKNDHMFINPRTGKAYTYHQMNAIWGVARRKVGLDHIKMYKALKHAGMTARVNATGNLVGTSGLARHTTIRMAEAIYTEPQLAAMRSAQEALKLPGSLVPILSPAPENGPKML